MTRFPGLQAWHLPRLTDADVLAIWRRIETKRQRVRVATARFRVGQHEPISKEKMNFARAAEHHFIGEIFKIVKVIYRRPLAVYEPEDRHCREQVIRSEPQGYRV